MGWEVRGGCRFYTRHRKVNGRVVREPGGAGAVGEPAAALDALRRRRRRAERDERLAERRRWGGAGDAGETVESACFLSQAAGDGGTSAKRSLSRPSAMVGCARMASRRPVWACPPASPSGPQPSPPRPPGRTS